MNEPTTYSCATEDAIARGRGGYEAGVKLEDNPFSASLDLRAAWAAGWKLAEAEAVIAGLNRQVARISTPLFWEDVRGGGAAPAPAVVMR